MLEVDVGQNVNLDCKTFTYIFPFDIQNNPVSYVEVLILI